MKLYKIAKNYNTDRNSEHLEYLHAYDAIIGEYRDKPINFIEIGTLLGESVRMWREYFSEAIIFSVEHPGSKHRVEEIFDITGTENLYRFKSNELKNTEFCFFHSQDLGKVDLSFDNSFFDVIIDDGDHDPTSQLGTFLAFWNKLKPGGFYFIEDIKGPVYSNLKKKQFFNLIVAFMDCFSESEIRMFSGDNNILGIIKKPVTQEGLKINEKKLTRFFNIISSPNFNPLLVSDILQISSSVDEDE